MSTAKRAELSFCEGCVEGKMQRKPFKPMGEIRSKRKLQCMHRCVGQCPQSQSDSGQQVCTLRSDNGDVAKPRNYSNKNYNDNCILRMLCW